MLKHRNRIIILALIMVGLVGVVSMISTGLIYQAAIDSQRIRLEEVVESHASLAHELGDHILSMPHESLEDSPLETVLEHLVQSHQQFQLHSETSEFTIAKRAGQNIRFLIVNGERVTKDSSLFMLPMDGPKAAPMKRALSGKTGTMTGWDYEGDSVLAAYTSFSLGGDNLGIVAKVHIDEIERPFTKANSIAFGSGTIIVLIGLLFLFKLTDPILKDITTSENKYIDLVEGAESLIVTIDKDGTISFANIFANQFLGYENEGLIGLQAMPTLFGASQPNDEGDKLNSCLSLFDGEEGSHEAPITLNSGREVCISWTLKARYDDKGKLSELLCIGNDVTLIREARNIQLKLEAQLAQAQKLETIGQLAAGIAHEINTPAQYVSSNTQFLGESFKTFIAMIEDCTELVAAIREEKSGEELLAIAERIPDPSDIEYLKEDIPDAVEDSMGGLERIAEIVKSVKQLAHPGEQYKETSDLNKIIRDSVTISTNEWKYVAEMEVNLADDLPKVNCLQGEISQVILNLIVNSAQAIEAKIGTNSEEKGQIEIKTFKEEDWAVIQISDTGSGMPEEVANKAFEPFFTTKDVGKGTGQGLAIAHNVIVTKHNGILDMETEEGEGSTFTIRLPLDSA